MSKTKLAKYGENRSTITTKAKNTRIAKYGQWCSPEELASRRKKKYCNLYNQELLFSLHHTEKRSATEIAGVLKTSISFVDKLLDTLKIKKLKFKHSKPEKDIISFIETIYQGKIEHRTIIDSVEVDIFIPDKNLAIEFNGNYWHSMKDKNYHLNKTNILNKNNIQLIHIFEHVWRNKPQQVKNLIYNKLLQRKTIFARKCELKQISPKIAREFSTQHHIEGFTGAKWHYGLFFNGNMVAYASFGNSRFGESGTELIRYCTSSTVVGGLSKITTNIMKMYDIKTLTSYVNKLYFDGHSYEKSGFKYIKDTQPDYVWLHPDKALTTYSRYQTQKRHLSSIINNYDAKKTEDENLYSNGFLKMWYTGHKKFVKEL